MTTSKDRRELVAQLQRCGLLADHAASAAVSLRGEDVCTHKCRDIAALCRVASELLVRRSSFEDGLLLVCVLSAEDCATACEQHPGAFFADCAQACRRLSHLADSWRSDGFDPWFDLRPQPLHSASDSEMEPMMRRELHS